MHRGTNTQNFALPGIVLKFKIGKFNGLGVYPVKVINYFAAELMRYYLELGSLTSISIEAEPLGISFKKKAQTIFSF